MTDQHGAGSQGAAARQDHTAWMPAPPPAAATSRVGALLPGYRDFVLIARSESSEVYRARQEGVDRPVAVKVLLLDDADAIVRFQREISITVTIGRQHPNIVTVIEVGTTATGRPCIVMEYYDHGSLQDRLRAQGPLPWEDVLAAGTVVADALSFAHRHGVLHRDIKPQNVLVLPTSYVVADFGIARPINAGDRTSSVEWFSYHHASPEVLDGERPSVTDDVWSVGSTLFTLLDGRPPFAADSAEDDTALAYMRRVRTGRPRPLSRPDVPPGLVAIIEQCLRRERSARFPDAASLHRALLALTGQVRAWAPPAPGPASVDPSSAMGRARPGTGPVPEQAMGRALASSGPGAGSQQAMGRARPGTGPGSASDQAGLAPAGGGAGVGSGQAMGRARPGTGPGSASDQAGLAPAGGGAGVGSGQAMGRARPGTGPASAAEQTGAVRPGTGPDPASDQPARSGPGAEQGPGWSQAMPGTGAGTDADQAMGGARHDPGGAGTPSRSSRPPDMDDAQLIPIRLPMFPPQSLASTSTGPPPGDPPSSGPPSGGPQPGGSRPVRPPSDGPQPGGSPSGNTGSPAGGLRHGVPISTGRPAGPPPTPSQPQSPAGAPPPPGPGMGHRPGFPPRPPAPEMSRGPGFPTPSPAPGIGSRAPGSDPPAGYLPPALDVPTGLHYPAEPTMHGVMPPAAMANLVASAVAASGYVPEEGTTTTTTSGAFGAGDRAGPPGQKSGGRRTARIALIVAITVVIGAVIGIGGTLVANLARTEAGGGERPTPTAPGATAGVPATGVATPPGSPNINNPAIAPTITAVTQNENSVLVEWDDRSQGQAQFVVVRVEDGTGEPLRTVEPGITQVVVDGLEPAAGPHCFLVIALVGTDRGVSTTRCSVD